MTLDLGPAREVIEDLMEDDCRITRPSGDAEAVFDPDSLGVTRPEPIVIYDGPCSVKERSEARERIFDEAGQEVANVSHILSIPINSATPQHDDVVEVIGSIRDPLLVGRTFTVRGIASAKTFAVSRKIGMQLRRRVDT